MSKSGTIIIVDDNKGVLYRFLPHGAWVYRCHRLRMPCFHPKKNLNNLPYQPFLKPCSYRQHSHLRNTDSNAKQSSELDAIPYDAVVSLNGSHCLLRDGTEITSRQISHEDFRIVRNLAEKYGFPLALEVDKGIFVNYQESKWFDCVTSILAFLSNFLCFRRFEKFSKSTKNIL